MMPRMRQALVEFENVEDAISCVQMCQVFVHTCYRYLCYIFTAVAVQSDLHNGQTCFLQFFNKPRNH